MNVNGIIEYLKQFDGDAQLAIIAIRLSDSTRHDIVSRHFITGEDFPALILELGESEDITEVIEEACKDE